MSQHRYVTNPTPYHKMSVVELQAELKKLELETAPLYCRIAARVKREIERRERRARRRKQLEAEGESMCCCGCGCEEVAGDPYSGYCRSCQNGMCGE